MKQRAVCLLLAIFIVLTFFGCEGKNRPESPDVVISAPPTKTLAPAPYKEPTSAPALALAPISPPPSPTSEPTQSPTITPGGMVALNEDFYYIPLNDTIKTRITGMSYPSDDSDAAINYDDLRYIHILHVDFSGNTNEGELIVNKKVAKDVMEIFHALYEAEYPLTSVNLVDSYGEAADDNLSMAANNTSAFNYRVVAGSETLSLHSYGMAVDINPLLNPYVKRDGSVSPQSGEEYADRSVDFPGKIDHNDLCYKLFMEHGWTWGGDWKNSKDYQHFSKKLD
jgi:hypothetical protein